MEEAANRRRPTDLRRLPRVGDAGQAWHVRSTQRGVLRGLHYQTPPRAQGKLVSGARGAPSSIAVDIRVDFKGVLIPTVVFNKGLQRGQEKTFASFSFKASD